MPFCCLSIVLMCLLLGSTAFAGDVTALADCVNRVFMNMGKKDIWTGKAPKGCGNIKAERRSDGIFVTAWNMEPIEGGWVMTSFTGAMGPAEITVKKDLAKANLDIAARSRRLERCLDSIISSNDPLECRDRAVKTYQAGEATGIETSRLIWLPDDGRHCVVAYVYGNTTTAPQPPAELFEGQPVMPGMILNLYPQKKQR